MLMRMAATWNDEQERLLRRGMNPLVRRFGRPREQKALTWTKARVLALMNLRNVRQTYVHHFICSRYPGGGWWELDYTGFRDQTGFLMGLGREAVESYAVAGGIIVSQALPNMDGGDIGRALAAVHFSELTIQDALNVFRLFGFEKAVFVLANDIPLEYAHAI